MSDLISRQMVLRCIKELKDNIDWGQSEDGDAFLHYTGTLYRSIASEECLPSAADMVEVVRCKDCKYMCHYTDGHLECRLLSDLKPIPTTYCTMNADDFCSYGERREDDKG